MILFLLHFQKWLMYVLSVQIIVQRERCKTTIIYENFAWFTEFEIEPSFGLLLVLHFNLYGDYILCRLDSPEEMWKWNQEKTLKCTEGAFIWYGFARNHCINKQVYEKYPSQNSNKYMCAGNSCLYHF